MKPFVILMLMVSLAGAEVVCRIERQPGGDLNLSWSDSTPTNGYFVEATTNLLDDSGSYAGDVDDWPTSTTNWLVDCDEPLAFFRVQRMPRGGLIGATNLAAYTTFEIAFYLESRGITNITVTHPVAIYKLTYTTFDVRGESTIASGALCVPIGLSSAPVVSYQHGTIFQRNEAPSGPDADDLEIGVILATEGYVVAMPDYLGLGMESPPLHPYVHARSEAVASVDMLRAAYSQLGTLSLTPNGKLFLCGYSQGVSWKRTMRPSSPSRRRRRWPARTICRGP